MGFIFQVWVTLTSFAPTALLFIYTFLENFFPKRQKKVYETRLAIRGNELLVDGFAP